MTNNTKCKECGMTIQDEYHPFAACLMYRQTRDADVVRVNLASVIDHVQGLETNASQHE